MDFRFDSNCRLIQQPYSRVTNLGDKENERTKNLSQILPQISIFIKESQFDWK